MMGQGFGDEIAAKAVYAVAIAIAIAAALGALAMWGIPKLWAWAMPIIHAATA